MTRRYIFVNFLNTLQIYIKNSIRETREPYGIPVLFFFPCFHVRQLLAELFAQLKKILSIRLNFHQFLTQLCKQ